MRFPREPRANICNEVCSVSFVLTLKLPNRSYRAFSTIELQKSSYAKCRISKFVSDITFTWMDLDNLFLFSWFSFRDGDYISLTLSISRRPERIAWRSQMQNLLSGVMHCCPIYRPTGVRTPNSIRRMHKEHKHFLTRMAGWHGSHRDPDCCLHLPGERRGGCDYPKIAWQLNN